MAEESAPEPKKSNKLIIIIVAALVVLLIVIGVVMFLLMGGEEEGAAGHGAAPTEQAAAPAEGGHGEAAPAEQATEGEAPAEGEADAKPTFSASKVDYKDYLVAGPMEPIGEIVVNLMSDSGKRYLKVNVVLELVDEHAGPEVKAKMDVIKSVINEILSSKTVDEASTSKGRQKIKAELLYSINQFLNDGKAKSVLFTYYVIQ